MVEDLERRINALFNALNCKTLSTSVIDQLLELTRGGSDCNVSMNESDSTPQLWKHMIEKRRFWFTLTCWRVVRKRTTLPFDAWYQAAYHAHVKWKWTLSELWYFWEWRKITLFQTLQCLPILNSLTIWKMERYLSPHKLSAFSEPITPALSDLTSVNGNIMSSLVHEHLGQRYQSVVMKAVFVLQYYSNWWNHWKSRYSLQWVILVVLVLLSSFFFFESRLWSYGGRCPMLDLTCYGACKQCGWVLLSTNQQCLFRVMVPSS